MHNKRDIIKVVISDEHDGGYAVADVDTLWKNRESGEIDHWKGRACKVYTKMNGKWKMIMHTGLLQYDET
jgi:hypothetical protein